MIPSVSSESSEGKATACIMDAVIQPFLCSCHVGLSDCHFVAHSIHGASSCVIVYGLYFSMTFSIFWSLISDVDS